MARACGCASPRAWGATLPAMRPAAYSEPFDQVDRYLRDLVTILSRSAVAALSAALVGLALLITVSGSLDSARERAFDVLLGIAPPKPAGLSPIVVDIDRESLAALGAWPWSRERLAELVAAITAAKPRVLAIDILLDEPDERSPAAIARRLASLTGEEQLARLAQSLPDGDARLTAAVRAAPTVMAVALDPDHAGPDPPSSQFLVRGRPDVSAVWHAAGAIGPAASLLGGAAGLGVVALPGDGDASVRRVPLLTLTGTTLRAGFALETLRVARSASAYLLSGNPLNLRVGESEVRLEADATLRLRPVAQRTHEASTISAVSILRDPGARARLHDAIVMLGSSAPELGGLRPSVSGDLVASVQIQSDALRQILAGDFPTRPPYLVFAELACALAFGGFAGYLALRRSPAAAALGAACVAGGWVLMSLWMLYFTGVLVNPIAVPVVAAVSFACVALVMASQVRRREAAIRRRFEQYVPPTVVRRMIEQPALLKLEGEVRDVSVLCADVEGFTAMTTRAEPRGLLKLLDRYFDGLTQIVIDHGGMVDKIVGDGLVALFNVPLNVPDHASRALDCAVAIRAFSRQLRATPEANSLGLGRTRIGMESGKLIVGDVGGRRRLDYTAYGEAMNLAARLEAANKELGSTICIGPNMGARLPEEKLHALGSIRIRGIAAPITVFEPMSECRPESRGSAERHVVSQTPAAGTRVRRERSGG
jgi:adenylate cyclase